MASIANRGRTNKENEVMDMLGAPTAASRAPKGRSRKQKEVPVDQPADKNLESSETLSPLTPDKKALQQRNLQLENELVTLTAQLEKVQLEKEEARQLLETETTVLRKKLAKNSTALVFEPKLDMTMAMAVDVSENGSKGKKQEKKDPRKPKKPLSAYFLWAKDNRDKIQEQNPTMGFLEIGKLVASVWKTVSEKDKKRYEEASSAESERYKIEKEVYDKIIAEEKHQEEALRLYREQQKKDAAMELMKQYEEHQAASKEGKSKRTERDPEKPKQPASAFFLFANERRPELQQEGKKYGIGEVGKLLGQEWKDMAKKPKQVFEDKARELREKYQKEMDTYKEKKKEKDEAARIEEAKRLEEEQKEAIKLYDVRRKEHEREQSALVLLKKTEQEAKEKKKLEREAAATAKKAAKDPNKPKRPHTAFLLFSSDVRRAVQQANPGASFVDVSRSISSMWKELDDAKKKDYDARVAPLWKEYNEAMKEYAADKPLGIPVATVKQVARKKASSSSSSSSSSNS